MTIQELKNFFETSDFSEETKNKLASILKDKTELTQPLLTELKSIMQEEIEHDITDAGIDITNDPEMIEIQKEYTTALDTIEKGLEADMAFVETELTELETARKQIEEIGDQMHAENIKQDILSQ